MKFRILLRRAHLFCRAAQTAVVAAADDEMFAVVVVVVRVFLRHC